MARVIVTGANGFVGSWLVRYLVKEGHEVHALVRKSSDLSELQDLKCQFSYGDVTDLASLRLAFRDVAAVFHLAGFVSYRRIDRSKMELVNVEGTHNVIRACVENKVPRLVYVSSVVAIGLSRTPDQILNENSSYNAHEFNLGYFETKHDAEELVKKAVREQGLDAVIVNPSTIYGAGDARKGSRSNQLKVARGTFPFFTSGGVNVVNIEAVIEGILAAWKIGRSGERYILSGENLTVEQLFQLIAKSAGVLPPSYKIPNSLLHAIGIAGDLMDMVGLRGPLTRENAWTSTLYHWFDNSKAKQELGFKPMTAAESIKNSVDWIRGQGLLADK